MLNGLGALLGGIFVGAVGMEVLRRKYPDALNKAYAKTNEVASGLKEAFKRGYENAAQSRQAPTSSN